MWSVEINNPASFIRRVARSCSWRNPIKKKNRNGQAEKSPDFQYFHVFFPLNSFGLTWLPRGENCGVKRKLLCRKATKVNAAQEKRTVSRVRVRWPGIITECVVERWLMRLFCTGLANDERTFVTRQKGHIIVYSVSVRRCATEKKKCIFTFFFLFIFTFFTILIRRVARLFAFVGSICRSVGQMIDCREVRVPLSPPPTTSKRNPPPTGATRKAQNTTLRRGPRSAPFSSATRR